MARRVALAAALWCSAAGASLAEKGDVCTGDVTLRSQEEVDQWNCTELAGTLSVVGQGVRSLRPLSRLTRIGGGLAVWSTTELRSLEGLHNVRGVGARPGTANSWQNVSLQIGENDVLESLMGLRAIRGAIPGGILLMGNPRLTSLDGMENITEVGVTGPPFCSIVLKNNARLESLQGLRGVRGQLPGSLEVILHPKLRTLDGLQSIAGADRLSVAGNLVLESLSAIRLRGVVREVIIQRNRALHTLQGLEGLWNVSLLSVNGHEVLSSLAALGNTTVTAVVEIESNPRLRSLHGLDMLTTVERLTIEGDANLESVDALCNIKGQVGSVHLGALDKLTSLQCFADVERYKLQDLTINPPLCFPEDARRKLVAQRSDLFANVPPASWDSARCHSCAEPCGKYEGKFVACDYLSGTCRYPLGRHGPSCVATAPAVSVVAGQLHHCYRPTDSTVKEPCSVCIQIRKDAVDTPNGPRAFGVYDSSGRSLYDAEQDAYGSLCNWTGCVDVGLRGEIQVTWQNDQDGAVEMSLVVGYGSTYEADLTVTLRVGYHTHLYPDSLLEGTLAQPPLTPSLPVYPWCIDSGDCSQISSVPIRLVVHGHGPLCGAGSVPAGKGCMGCADGEVAAEGAASCTQCGMWETPDQSQAVCLFQWRLCLTLVCGLLCIMAGAAMLCAQVEWTGWRWSCRLPFGGKSLPIEDVALERDVVVLLTARSHGLRVSKSAAFSVAFEGTHHPDLDSPGSQIRARAVAHDKLELLDSAGAPLTSRLDTSTGVLRLSVRPALCRTWGVPVGIMGPALLGGGVAVVVMGSSLVGHAAGHGIGGRGLAVLISAGLAAAGAARLAQAWRRGRVRTLLDRRVHEYLQELPASPQACARGPSRAIRAEQLMHFHGHFQPFIKDRTMYYVVSNIIQPLTVSSGVSFAELVGPSPLAWFVSHYWGHGFGQLCQSVQKHAQATAFGRWEEQAYWICSFSNNQHQVPDELGRSWQESSFYLALGSQGCRGTCLVLDERALPLTRSWCLFEVVKTIDIEDARPGFTGLLFCTHTGVMNFGQATVETSMALARRVTSIRLQDADASEATDKQMIDALVVNEMGGFDAMNAAVRARLASALQAAKAAALAEFQEVEAELVGAGAVAASTPPAFTRTGLSAEERPPGAGTLLVSMRRGAAGAGQMRGGKLAAPHAAGEDTPPSQLPADLTQVDP